MESITFKCTKTADELNNIKRKGLITIYIVLPLMMVFTSGIFIWMYIETYEDMLEDLLTPSSEFFLPAILVVFVTLLMLVFWGWLIHVLIHTNESTKMMYDIIENKEFGWNAINQRFEYKDKYRSFTFTSDDIVKWVSVTPRYSEVGTNIIRLRNENQIVLEGVFNPDIHKFLRENQYALRLPSPVSFTMTTNVYKDPI